MNRLFIRDLRLIFLFQFLIVVSHLYAINTNETRTINVSTAGKLSSLLPSNEREYVVSLTLTGKLNGTDFNILRTMATSQKLQTLDLSNANIVSGGASYYSNYGTNYYTKDNEFGYSLFNGCKKIQKIVLPNSLLTIGQCAFWYCSNLKTLVIGSKVTTIKPGLWGGCSQLTDVQIKNNSNFHLDNGILYNKNYTTIIAALLTWNYGDLSIRSGVTEIQYEAFSFCSKMSSVSFPSSVTTIGDTAFEYTGISSVKFTSAITSIGSFAFSGCKNLKDVDLTPLKLTSLDYGVFMTSNVEIVYMPKSLKELKQSVFSGTPLKHIFVYTATPATMYDLATSSPTFKNVDVEKCTVHVPQGKVNTYKGAAGWKDFLYITDSQEIEPEKPNTISTVEDLQEKLDEIAKKGLSGNHFETVEIAHEGVFVDKPLYVRNGCRVLLTGGLLRISPNIGSHYCITIDSKSFLFLGNIIVDLMNNDFHINSGIFYNMGELRINSSYYKDGVRFVNVPISRGDYGECIFYNSKGSNLIYDNHGLLKTGNISIIKADDMAEVNIWDGELESYGAPTIDGTGRISLDATIYGSNTNGCIVNAKEYWSLEARGTFIDRTGGATYIKADKVYFSGFGNDTFKGNGRNIIICEYASISGNSQVPTLFLRKNAYINLASNPMQVEWTLDAEWADFTLENVVVENVPSADDFSKMTFLNMPIEREAYYDDATKTVKLRERKVCDADDMQKYVLQYDSEGNSIEVPLCDEPTFDDDVELNDVQAVVDGSGKGVQPILFAGGCICVRPTSSMSFRSVSFASKDASVEGGGIKNSGMLTFENCTFQQGSYTIENSGVANIGSGVIGCNIINKYGGRIQITSPLTSELTITIPTAEDVEPGVAIITGISSADNITLSVPSGYAWKYDETAGGIVVYSASGINVVEQKQKVESIYDASGRKVKGQQTKGLTIQRMSDGTVKKAIIKK